MEQDLARSGVRSAFCRDSQLETRISLETGVANGHFQRPEEPVEPPIGPLNGPPTSALQTSAQEEI